MESGMKALQSQGYYFRYAAIATLLAGMYLHVTSLFIGRDLLRQYILTPTFDMLLAIPMTYAGLIGWLSWKQVSFGRGWKKFLWFHSGLLYDQHSDPCTNLPDPKHRVYHPFLIGIATLFWC
jgi:hypothetical protein